MGLFKTFSEKMKFVLNNITIEPAMFVYYLFYEICIVPFDQLKIDKSCLNDFNYTQDVCDNLLDGNHDDENTAVQNEVSL